MTLRVHPDEIVARSTSPLVQIHPSWERVRLGDVADILNGFAFKSNAFSSTEGVPLIRIRDVGSAATTVNYTGEYDNRYLVSPGTIIVGMDGDFRTARWTGPPALLNQRVCTIEVRDGQLYDEDFLLTVLPAYLDAIHAATSSITVKHLSSETLKQLPLPLPPLAEQRRIVAVIEEQLSRLDLAQRTLEIARERASTFIEQTLAAEFDRTNDERVKLGDVAEWGSGGTPKADTPAYYGGSIPWAVIGDLNDDVVTVTRGSITEAGLRNSSAKIVEPGAVLVAMYGSIGKLGIAGVAMATNQAIAFAVPRTGLNRDYLFWFLRSQRFRLLAAARGATQANISQTILRGWSIPMPDQREQAERVARVEAAHSRASGLVREIESARKRSSALHRALLARAFRGELVLQDPNDEPASVLLERIAAERAAARKPPQRKRRRKAAA
jgi:type I restriction enzyme S subunit